MSASSGTVLVTGSRGFTGEHLCPVLRRAGWRVHGVVHGATGGTDESECDLTEPAAVRSLVARVRPSHVVHLAGMAFVAERDPAAYYRVNVLGTTHLLDALSDQSDDVQKVVVASSANVYGRPETPLIEESRCPAPVNHYGCSKLSMEYLAANWFEQMPIIVTRPFNYTGPGQDERYLVPKIAAHYARRAPILKLGNMDVRRDFSDVRDVADVYARLLRSDGHSTCVNICSGHARSLRSILQECEEITGHQVKASVDPSLVRRNEIPELRGSTTRLEGLVGRRKLTPFRQTLKDLITYHANAT